MKSWLLASEADLFLIELPSTTHATSVSWHLASAIGISTTGLCLAIATRGLSSFAVVLILSWVLAYAVATRPRRIVHQRAQNVRRQLELATAVFLDLINVLLAGGAGIETSVIAAAQAGDGAGFSIIRLAVMKAQSARLSYWDALAEIGQIAEVPTLLEVAHTVQLAGQHGARIRSSLSSKAIALRKRNLAQVEHDEEQRTEKIGLPLVVLFVGFLILVGYPAFTQTVTSF